MSRIRLGLVLFLAISLPIAAQAEKKPIGSKTKDEIKAALNALVKAKSDTEKEKAEFSLLSFGRQGIEYLETFRTQKEYADVLALFLASAPDKLGFDILKTNVVVKEEFDSSYFSLDEIVLLKRADQFAGFAVDAKGSNATEGKILVRWWSQHGEIKKLAEAGGKSGTIEITGKKSTTKFRPNAGYDEFDFEVPIEEARVQFHFVGPATFRMRYSSDVSIALTGQTKPDSLSSTDKKIEYRSSYPSSLAKITKLLQRYMFRVVPGCIELPLDDASKEGFAQFEQVQVHVRETRPGREPIVLVWFLEPQSVQLADYHRKFIYNFANEITSVKDENIVILGGMAPSMEGNQSWTNTAWERLPQKLVKLLRTNMPENL